MCVEATRRAPPIDLGVRAAVVAGATATRDLPDPLTGATIAAADVHHNALAAMARIASPPSWPRPTALPDQGHPSQQMNQRLARACHVVI